MFATAGASLAQPAYPSRPITLIVPFPPGGSTDVIGRIIAEGLRAELGQPVVVENRAGAGGSTGTAAIAKAIPDGYTIGMGTGSTLAVNPAVYKSLPYDVLTDLAPVSNVAAVPNIISVHPSIEAASLAELIAVVRKQSGKLAYASAGNGTVSHVMGEQFKLAAGIDLLHVPYRGIGPALNDVVGGQVQVLFDNLPTSLPMVQSGRLRGVAVSGPKRVAALPRIPTFAEQGFEDLNWMAFFGIVVAARTPQAIVARLHEALVRAMTLESVRKRLASQEAMVVANSPAEFAAEIRRELARMRAAVEAARIEVK
jgi:tripartite-type tricarboxylate transporter receptor subunit TctC